MHLSSFSVASQTYRQFDVNENKFVISDHADWRKECIETMFLVGEIILTRNFRIILLLENINSYYETRYIMIDSRLRLR